MAGVELAFLQVSPVYWGYGVPHGDGSAVVLVPGFLGTDLYLTQFAIWLRRIGYQAFYSGIPLNADCPNLLIRRNLNDAILQANKSTKGKIHLIGHSLGGSLARAAAAQMPERVASVITLGAPIRGIGARASVMSAADMVRRQILERHGGGVLPNCYTSRCTCEFFESLRGEFPKSVRQTAIHTKSDGILDWQCVKRAILTWMSKYLRHTSAWSLARSCMESWHAGSRANKSRAFALAVPPDLFVTGNPIGRRNSCA